MYNNSSTQDKILNFQKTHDLKALISTIRLTTNLSRNSVNVSINRYLLLFYNFSIIIFKTFTYLFRNI